MVSMRYCWRIVLVFLVSTQFIMNAKCSRSQWQNDEIYLTGFSVATENVIKQTFIDKDRRLNIPEKVSAKLQLFGKFSSEASLTISFYSNCTSGTHFKMDVIKESEGTMAEADIKFPEAKDMDNHTIIYFCLNGKLQGRSSEDKDEKAPTTWLTIKLIKPLIPLWLNVVLISILLLLSALFSGLNLGILALDRMDLNLIINTGSQKQKSEARAIVPVRNHGNYLLCSLVFSNVLVNTVLTLVMDKVFVGNGETVAFTTLMVVVFGEILPQAVCSRYGLTVGARTIYITKFFMFITFPIAYPIGKFLDAVLGEDVGSVFTRDRIKQLLKVTRDQHGLEREEMEIITGTLEMKRKTVKDIMVPFDQMVMIDINGDTSKGPFVEAKNSGYSRIPVYDGDRQNVIAIVTDRQLNLLDQTNPSSLKKLAERPESKNHLFFVYENTRLDFLLQAFREGTRGHMAIVQRLNDDGPGDTEKVTVGLVTLEDVLEELLQTEIYDEADVERREVQQQTSMGQILDQTFK